ncbi:MAG: YsnF/AvaK domain-containing protein [Candidatus Accumulibacter sp. UW27]|jgi:uncharacterized protein (TIGR02271 family)
MVTPPGSEDEIAPPAAGRTIPVIDESLHVHKRELDQGGYRISRRLESRQELVDEPLRHTRVEIERRPVGVELDSNDMPGPRQEGDTLIIPVVEEFLVTEKRLLLVEEVRVTHVYGTHRQPQQVTLRRHDISIQRLAAQEPGVVAGADPMREGIPTLRMEDIEEKMMSSVLVGIFDTQTAAEEARRDLLAAGFPPHAISMTGDTVAAATHESSATADSPRHEGAIARFFNNLFGGRDDDSEHSAYAERYQEAFRRGSCGVAVTTANDAEMDEAENILNAAGAVDIDERSVQWRQEGWTGGSTTPAGSLEGGATRTLPEVEEELTVGKRTVVRGGVRVFTRVTEVPVEESVRLREEHVNVERVAVNRPATEADFAAVKEESIEVREMAEEPVVSKTSRVVGEVEIGKTATEREETVRGTVRKTRVDVEDLPDNQTSAHP